MFLRKFRTTALALLCVLGAAAPSFAQAPPPSDAPDPSTPEGKRVEGKARYERGAEAYAAGRYKDAIDLFLQADALAPSAALSFNIARAYEKIEDDASTLQWYRDFRRRAPDAKNGDEVDEHIHALEGVLAKKGVQQLTVLSTPLSATVVVDEQPVGVTPFTGQFPPGTHKVVLRLRGYSDSEQKVELPADRAQDLQVPLVPAREQSAAPGSSPPTPLAAGGTGVPARNVGASPEHASGPRFGIWPWIGLGAGAAALGGSLGFELSRRGAESDANDDKTQVGYQEKLEREQSRQKTARVLAAVGGTLVVASGALLVIDLTTRKAPSSEHARLGFACLPGNCALDLRGQF